ncbi:unnamed protein product [Closterium sp. NIES-65]|nr:unnamed protein product [Closterium sp. NIES-65]
MQPLPVTIWLPGSGSFQGCFWRRGWLSSPFSPLACALILLPPHPHRCFPTPAPPLPHTRTSASPHPHLRFPTPARLPPHHTPTSPPYHPPPPHPPSHADVHSAARGKLPPEANVSQVLECGYQSSTATLFGIIGGMLLAAGMALISVLGGCVCCVTIQYAHGQALKVSIVCYTLAWVAFFLAEICLMSGGSLNNYHKEVTNYQYDFQLRTCYQLKTSTYIVGAVMSILTVVFAVLYYGQAQKSKYEAWVEQGAPTPRLYSLETMKSFVIAGPARAGPLKSEDDDEDEDDMGDEEEEEYDVFDEEEEDDDDTRPLNPRRHDDDDDDNDGNRAH